MRYLLPVIFILFYATSSYAYTWQDVLDIYNQTPPPHCINWIEEATDESGQEGYKIWQRCNSGHLTKRVDVYGTGPYDNWQDDFKAEHLLCDGTGYGDNQFYNWAYKLSNTYHIKTYCDGSIERVDYSGWSGYPFASQSPCHIARNWATWVHCEDYDQSLVTFFPVERCYNGLTNTFSPCAENCKDPVNKAGIEEICGDGIDNNCNGQTDEGCEQCFDNDRDGYYAYNPLYCPQGDDCNDNETTTHPGAPDLFDGIDNNCNGEIDEGLDHEELTKNLGMDQDNPNAPEDPCFSSTANFSTGNLYNDYTIPLGFTDLIISSNSLDSYSGPFGKGWTHTFNTNLSNITDPSLILTEGDGRRVKFTSTDGTTYTPEDRFGKASNLTKNSDSTFTLREKNGTIYDFDTNGRLTSIEDRNGNTTTLDYTGTNLTTITGPYGRTVDLVYSGVKITSIEAPLGKIYILSYTGDLLTSITDPDGGETIYTYNGDEVIISVENPGGDRTTYTYDEPGRILSSTDSLGSTKTVEYIEEERTVITDRNGNVTEYIYDRGLNVTRQVTDPLGYVTIYTHDGRGNLLSITHPDGLTEAFSYDTDDNLLTYTDRGENITTYNYELNYNQITSIIDPLNRTTTLNYDTKGNLIILTDPLNNTTTLTYDNRGRITDITDPLEKTTSMTYDAYGNVSNITDQIGNKKTYSWDAIGNLEKVIDANENPTTYTYDNLNRLVSVTDGLSHITTYTYGPGCSSCGYRGDNPTSITDGNGNITTFQYDLKGRLIRETDPLGNTTTYSYDGEGNLKSKRDANGNTITFTYDPLNRLISKNFPDGTQTTFTHDARGNIIAAGNKHITYTYSHDTLGRATQVSDSNGKVTTYRFDAMSNRIQMTDPEGGIIKYSYDKLNRLTALRPSASKLITYSYDPLHRRTGLTYPNGANTFYSFDSSGRLTGILSQNSQFRTVNKYSYTFDGVGNRITKTETRDILHNRRWREKEERTTYIYDQIHRLTGTEHTRIMGNDREKAKRYRVEEHTYDPAGNRLTGPKHRTGYTYNQGNQLLTVKRRQYKYDNNGNLIKKVEIDKNGKEDKTTLYTYDYDNKLIKVIKQESGKYITVTFAYDPFGRRILKTLLKEKEGEVTTRTTSYIYDNEDIIFEENKNGEITRYTHGPGIDEPISIEQKGKAYYYHFDGLGSVTALTDSDGEVAKEYTYDPFGRLKMKGEKLKQPYTYTGREWDSETGLYYYRARYYDPKIGRFITKDPFPGILLNPQTLNPYPYVGNNPVNHLDPLGLWYIDIGFSGSTTGTLGPGVAGGIQIGPAGIFIYGGFGVGFGAGASATINTSDPSVGVSVIATGRGGYLAGSQISYSYGQEGGL